ncbi:MAG: cysteine peptidase family C39 domain-containing protein, partial [Sphingobacteriales bacterium]
MKVTLQKDSVDCGPACLHMVFSHYGVSVSLDTLIEMSDLN